VVLRIRATSALPPVVHVVLRAEPEVGVHQAAAGQRGEEIVGDVALGQPHLRGAEPVHVEVERGVVEHLGDAHVDHPRDAAHPGRQLPPDGVALLEVVRLDDHVDRRGEAEVQHLGHDVRGLEVRAAQGNGQLCGSSPVLRGRWPAWEMDLPSCGVLSVETKARLNEDRIDVVVQGLQLLRE
jgi:hypothetical protein